MISDTERTHPSTDRVGFSRTTNDRMVEHLKPNRRWAVRERSRLSACKHQRLTQPQLHPALWRLSAMISQSFTPDACAFTDCSRPFAGQPCSIQAVRSLSVGPL